MFRVSVFSLLGFLALLSSVRGFSLPSRTSIKLKKNTPGSSSSGNGNFNRPSLKLNALGTNDADEDDNEKRGEKSAAGNGAESSNPLAGLINWAQSEEGKEDLRIYGTSLAVALVLRTFVVEPRWIPSLSMYPTFDIGDQLAVDKLSKVARPYQRRDVVVFTPPDAFSIFSDRRGEALIKRVVAVAGDVVEIKDGGHLFINGEKQEEKYTNEDALYEWGPQTVPKGCVLVLGDNRNHSLDGHVWGFLPTDNIIGRAVFKYWPPWRAGGIAVE